MSAAHDTSTTVHEAAIKSQAIVRAAIGLPIVSAGGVILSSGGNQIAAYVALTIGAYILGTLWLAFARHRVPPRYIACFTAVADPLMESSWIPAMGEYGGLVIGFYLFTILGFGFRTGVSLMRVCQVSAIAGFVAVLFVVPFWQTHIVIWLSFLITIVIVPAYAAVLIEKLHAATAIAEKESKSKSELLARVSHELRTPLTGIVAAAQLMVMESKHGAAVDRAQSILELSKDLVEEIEDLLDQSKYEGDALSIELAETNLRELLNKVRITLEPSAARKGIRFELCIDEMLPTWILADEHYLRRVLVNLGGNAVKFTGKGSVSLAASLIAEDERMAGIRFSVSDTGRGIAPEFHRRIFDPFFQVDDDGQDRRTGGTGLGMAIASNVVKLMGGEIVLDSGLGMGSRFTFDLTFQKTAGPYTAQETAGTAVVRGKHVLIVDDHQTNLSLFKEILLQDGHTVATAMSGMEALTFLSSHEFDIVFLDYNLGDMDGAKVAQLYRFGNLKPAPIVFITADATPLTRERLMGIGVAGMLAKPLTQKALRQTLADIFQSRGATADLPADVDARPKQQRPALNVVKLPPAAKVPVINEESYQRLCEMSRRENFVREMMEHAMNDIERNGALLVKALAARNLDDLEDAAHSLKGVCEAVGADRLASLSTGFMGLRAIPAESLGEDFLAVAKETVAELQRRLGAAAAAPSPLAESASVSALHPTQHVHRF